MNTNVSREHRERMLAHLVHNTRVTITWVPREEAYPEPDQTVLVSLDGGITKVWFAFTDGSEWLDAATGGPFFGRVTHWAEMPMGVNP